TSARTSEALRVRVCAASSSESRAWLRRSTILPPLGRFDAGGPLARAHKNAPTPAIESSSGTMSSNLQVEGDVVRVVLVQVEVDPEHELLEPRHETIAPGLGVDLQAPWRHLPDDLGRDPGGALEGERKLLAL